MLLPTIQISLTLLGWSKIPVELLSHVIVIAGAAEVTSSPSIVAKIVLVPATVPVNVTV
jgi:hypothetical protein